MCATSDDGSGSAGFHESGEPETGTAESGTAAGGGPTSDAQAAIDVDLADPSQHLAPVLLEGTMQLDEGTVPCVWISRLPDELAGERGRFDVQIRFGANADVAGVRFEGGTVWIPLAPALVREAAEAGRLAVITGSVDESGADDQPYFTIDWPGS